MKKNQIKKGDILQLIKEEAYVLARKKQLYEIIKQINEEISGLSKLGIGKINEISPQLAQRAAIKAGDDIYSTSEDDILFNRKRSHQKDKFFRYISPDITKLFTDNGFTILNASNNPETELRYFIKSETPKFGAMVSKDTYKLDTDTSQLTQDFLRKAMTLIKKLQATMKEPIESSVNTQTENVKKQYKISQNLKENNMVGAHGFKSTPSGMGFEENPNISFIAQLDKEMGEEPTEEISVLQEPTTDKPMVDTVDEKPLVDTEVKQQLIDMKEKIEVLLNSMQ